MKERVKDIYIMWYPERLLYDGLSIIDHYFYLLIVECGEDKNNDIVNFTFDHAIQSFHQLSRIAEIYLKKTSFLFLNL